MKTHSKNLLKCEHLGEDLENEPQDLHHYHSHPHHNPQHHHHVLQICHLIKILSNVIQQLLLNIIKQCTK